MPEQALIDVCVIVNGQSLQEYRESEATDEGIDRVRYIEVKAGQEFGIQITWRTGFDLKWADALYYKFRVDDLDFYSYGEIEKRDICHRRGTLANDVSRIREGVTLKNDTTGEWEACPYVFGVLGMTDDDPIDLTLKPKNIQNLGSIRIQVYRANKVKRDEPYFWSGERPETLDEISEKVLKGRALKNNVKFPNGPRTAGPQGEHFTYNPMPNIEGTVYKFTFLYRTRKILQSLGCVPRSPSPSPDRQLALERAEDTIRLEKQRAREANLEILRLREELARSRSGSRQTSDLTDSDPFAPATIRGGRNTRSNPAHQSPYIKREHTESRSLESRITRPHPPLFTDNNGSQKNPVVEIVDLSGETEATGPRCDLSLADEVDEILRSVEQRDDVSEEAAGTPLQKKRKRPVEDDNNDIVELPPKKTRTFEIVDLTDG